MQSFSIEGSGRDIRKKSSMLLLRQNQQCIAMNDKEGLCMQSLMRNNYPNLKKTILYLGGLGTLPISGAGREI